jgi:hypothetical protein
MRSLPNGQRGLLGSTRCTRATARPGPYSQQFMSTSLPDAWKRHRIVTHACSNTDTMRGWVAARSASDSMKPALLLRRRVLTIMSDSMDSQPRTRPGCARASSSAARWRNCRLLWYLRLRLGSFSRGCCRRRFGARLVADSSGCTRRSHFAQSASRQRSIPAQCAHRPARPPRSQDPRCACPTATPIPAAAALHVLRVTSRSEVSCSNASAGIALDSSTKPGPGSGTRSARRTPPSPCPGRSATASRRA